MKGNDALRRCVLITAVNTGFDVKVARIFNTYGPRMQIGDGRVISNFIVQALRNQSISIYGDGSQTRSFCYVDDLIGGMVRLMNTEADFGGPLNLGNQIEIAIGDLADLVIELTNSHSKVITLPLPEDDPRQRRPSISRAEEMLNWQPKVTLEEGLRKTIDYFESELKRL